MLSFWCVDSLNIIVLYFKCIASSIYRFNPIIAKNVCVWICNSITILPFFSFLHLFLLHYHFTTSLYLLVCHNLSHWCSYLPIGGTHKQVVSQDKRRHIIVLSQQNDRLDNEILYLGIWFCSSQRWNCISKIFMYESHN